MCLACEDVVWIVSFVIIFSTELKLIIILKMEDQKPEDYYDLYSRQYFTFGEHAMNKIGKASLFLYNVGGVGVEIGLFFLSTHI